jgi:hypothetical protein
MVLYSNMTIGDAKYVILNVPGYQKRRNLVVLRLAYSFK